MRLEGNWRLYAINSGPGFVVPAQKVGCVVKKCPHSAGEVPNVVLIIHLAHTSMFAMGSFCPTGPHLRSCMIIFKFWDLATKLEAESK
jgi:hypothetical protein